MDGKKIEKNKQMTFAHQPVPHPYPLPMARSVHNSAIVATHHRRPPSSWLAMADEVAIGGRVARPSTLVTLSLYLSLLDMLLW